MARKKHGAHNSEANEKSNPEFERQQVKLPGGRTGFIRKRGASFQADFGYVDGKRIMKQRKSLGAARDWLREMAIQQRNHGAAGFDLTSEQRVDAASALKVLEGTTGVSLTDAAEFFIRMCGDEDGEILTVAEMAAAYEADAVARNLRAKSVKDIHYVMRRLVAAYGEVPASQISRRHAQAFINNLSSLSPTSRAHYKGVCSAAFNFALDEGYVINNPFRAGASKRRIIADERMPRCLTLPQVRCLLAKAVESDQSMLPAIVLCLFAGLRTEEVRQLEWTDIDLRAKRVTVRAEIAKKRRIGHVELSDNAVKWLTPYRQSSGYVAPQGQRWRHRFERLRASAGLMQADGTWDRSILRHSFGSYHLAAYEDAAKTAFQMRHHRDTDQLFQHYRALVTKEDAVEYWKIEPEEADGVIVFKAG